MGKERSSSSSEGQPTFRTRVTGVSLDLEQRTLSFTAADRCLATLRLAPEGLIFESPASSADKVVADTISTSEAQGDENSSQAPRLGSTESEKERAIVFQGKLKSKPIPGRPDARGNPTAWARFSAHDPDQDGAHLYSATFHRHTVNLALSMDKDTPLTVQGFPHERPNTDTRRLDTLSVINILDYPGKPTDK